MRPMMSSLISMKWKMRVSAHKCVDTLIFFEHSTIIKQNLEPLLLNDCDLRETAVSDSHSSTLNMASNLRNVSCPSRHVSVSQPLSFSHSDSPR